MRDPEHATFTRAVRGGFDRTCLAASASVFTALALVLVLGQAAGLDVPYWMNHFIVGSLLFFVVAAIYPAAAYFVDGCWLAGLACGTTFYAGKEIGTCTFVARYPNVRYRARIPQSKG